MLSALVLAVTALAAPLVAAPSAHAAAPCAADEYGPYWFGNVNASRTRGTTVVLAIDSPWGNWSKAYLWSYNNDNRQKFCLRPNSSTGDVNYYQFRYAANLDLCLTAPTLAAGQRLELLSCNSSLGQVWGWVPNGTAIVNGVTWAAIRFHERSSGMCMDVYGGYTGNGTAVQLFTCKAGDHQRWF